MRNASQVILLRYISQTIGQLNNEHNKNGISTAFFLLQSIDSGEYLENWWVYFLEMLTAKWRCFYTNHCHAIYLSSDAQRNTQNRKLIDSFVYLLFLLGLIRRIVIGSHRSLHVSLLQKNWKLKIIACSREGWCTYTSHWSGYTKRYTSTIIIIYCICTSKLFMWTRIWMHI